MKERDRTRHHAIRGRWPVLDLLLNRTDEAGEVAPARRAREKEKRKQEYEAFNRRLNEGRIGRYAFFQNYGYVPNESPTFSVVTPAEGHFDANSRRLVLEVIGDCPVDDRDVLDVSCGRGAVPVVLGAHFRPRSYLGVDLSSEAVAFCRRHHGRDGFAFEEGDAESLPVAGESRDVVVNVEASHNYASIERFFDEVRRVLRPHGWFLYTDFLPPEAFERHRLRLEEMDFVTVRDLDITKNVLLSSDEMAEKRLQLYEDDEERAYMADFLAAPGSDMYRALEEGSLAYRLYAFQRRDPSA